MVPPKTGTKGRKKRRRRGPPSDRSLSHEERMLKHNYKKFLTMGTFGATFSISTTLIASVLFKSAALFNAFLFCLVLYAALLSLYYTTYVKRIISYRQSAFVFIWVFVVGVSFLMYIAGGFGGAMISCYFAGLIILALMLRPKEVMYMTGVIVAVYTFFFVGETVGVIKPIITDVFVIKYSKAIIDYLSFFLFAYTVRTVVQNAQDSARFYKLRSERLSKIRKRLEFLVGKRTKELQDSNESLRKAQIELRKSYKELKKLDKKKDEFISIASHELQTPMASIYGFSQLLQDKKIFMDAGKRGKYLKIIENETKRLSKMVKDMLNLSRIDLGTLRFEIEEVNLDELLEQVVLQLRGSARAKRLKLVLKAEKPLPKITTDREKLTQILINIVTNAIKYTERGWIEVGAKRQGGYVLFSVADTGIGIPKSQQEKIFERFYQIQSPYTRKALGAGLGLSIVREFIKVMGGKIWLKSKVGRGTTFYFTVPLKFTPPKSQKYAKQALPVKRETKKNVKAKKRSKTK